MISGLKPYAQMKTADVPGVDAVPSHWRVRKLRGVLSPVAERNRPDLPLLSVVRERGVVLRDTENKEENHNFIPDDLSNYKVVRAGQFAMNKMKAWQGSYGVSRHDGIVSPAYFTFGLSGVEGNFFHLAIRSIAYVPFFTRASDGVRVGQWDLSQSRMKEIPFLIPPSEEQAAIVRFLDHADRRIRRAIATKQKLLRLLEEQRRAIIHRAVTRGLDPDVRLKPSGIEWLGDVPESWRIGRVKSELRNLNTRRIPLSSSKRGSMTQRTYDYYGASGVIDKVDDYLFDDDLILIAEDGANLVLRNLPLAIIARGRFWVNNHAHILRPLKGSLEYFAALLECINYLPWITGAAQPKLTKDRLMAISIPVPSEDEQNEIAAWIEANTKNLRTSAQRVKREIELLREYRTRLVSDVVTGKIDVRKAAESMPEIIECGDSECGEAEEYEDDSLENITTEDQAE